MGPKVNFADEWTAGRTKGTGLATMISNPVLEMALHHEQNGRVAEFIYEGLHNKNRLTRVDLVNFRTIKIVHTRESEVGPRCVGDTQVEGS